MQKQIQLSVRKPVTVNGYEFILTPAPRHPDRFTLTIKPIALDTKEKTGKT